MRRDESHSSFEEFVNVHGVDLRRALVAAVGVDSGLDAASEALAYGWEHWDRVGAMDNPAGYLYRVGRDRARTRRNGSVQLPPVRDDDLPWVEPALPSALAGLPEMQRTAVVLVHTFGYSLAEAAALLGVSKGTVQTHVERALANLRLALGVEQ